MSISCRVMASIVKSSLLIFAATWAMMLWCDLAIMRYAIFSNADSDNGQLEQ